MEPQLSQKYFDWELIIYTLAEGNHMQSMFLLKRKIHLKGFLNIYAI